MMHPAIVYVQHITLCFHKLMHPLNGFGLIIVSADVHALHTQPLVVGEEVHSGKIGLLFPFRLLLRPCNVCPRHKLRQADHGDKTKILLVPIVNAQKPSSGGTT